MRSARSKTHGVAGPGELLGGGQPGGPEPTTATVLPVLHARAPTGVTQPSSQARSMIAHLDLLDGHRPAG
jgi:hypothetical protein